MFERISYARCILYKLKNLRPVSSFATEHGLHTPARAEHVQRFRKAVVVDHSSVHGKNSH